MRVMVCPCGGSAVVGVVSFRVNIITIDWSHTSHSILHMDELRESQWDIPPPPLHSHSCVKDDLGAYSIVNKILTSKRNLFHKILNLRGINK